MSSPDTETPHTAGERSEGTAVEPLEFLIRDFEAETDAGLVFSTWRGSRQPREVLGRLLRRCGVDVRCVVAEIAGGHDHSLYGWAAAETSGAIIWAFTVDVVRRGGVMRALLSELGVSLESPGPIPCRFWSGMAGLLAEKHSFEFAPVRAQRLAGVQLTEPEQAYLLKALSAHPAHNGNGRNGA